MEWKNSNPFNISFLLCISLFLYFFPPESTMLLQPMLQLWGLWRLLFLLTYLCFYCPICVFFFSKRRRSIRRGWRKQPRRQRHQHQERPENRQQSSLVCPLLFCISFCISLCISFCICKYKRKGPSVWRWLQPSSDVGRQEQRALTQERRGQTSNGGLQTTHLPLGPG